MKTRTSIETIHEKLPLHVKLDETTYKGIKIKARFIDVEYGEFWSIPYDVINGHDHRMRANEKISIAKTKSLLEFKCKLPDFLLIKDESYKGMNKEAIFIDIEYGEFKSTPKNILRGKKHRGRGIKEIPNLKLTVTELKQKLPKHISILEDTYCGAMKKCQFIDCDYGLFEATPNSIIKNNKNHPIRAKENKKKTCILKYGVEHPSQNREVLLKMKRGARKTYKKIHWETGEELLCCGGYECKVVDYLNAQKIKFNWQIPFKLENIGTYYCDLYLISKDTYVEIKGWWRQKISKDKWELFHKKYPNSELWDEFKLKELGIKIR